MKTKKEYESKIIEITKRESKKSDISKEKFDELTREFNKLGFFGIQFRGGRIIMRQKYLLKEMGDSVKILGILREILYE